MLSPTYHGHPCTHGHTLRYSSNRTCVQCRANRKRADPLTMPRRRLITQDEVARTRTQAIAQGMTYYQGTVCPYAHTTSPRYTKGGQCVECVRLRSAHITPTRKARRAQEQTVQANSRRIGAPIKRKRPGTSPRMQALRIKCAYATRFDAYGLPLFA